MSLAVAAILAESAARRPEHVAVVFGAQKLTYRELWLRARKYAAVLQDMGTKADDRVALLLPNTPDFPVAYFAVLALGGVVVPLPALLKASEIEHVLRDSGASLLICAGNLLQEGLVAAQAAGIPALAVVAPDGADVTRLDELAEQATAVPDYRPRAPDDVAVLLYTSGTTGRPKGAMLSQLNIALNVNTTMLCPYELRPDDVLFGCLPLSHSYGQICVMGTCFRAGVTMVLMQRFDGAGALDLMMREQCTVFMGVPTMYIALLEAAKQDQRRPPLDRAFSGGASLPVKILQQFEQTFGCQIYEGYGLTETSAVTAYNQKPWPCKPGTVGRGIWGVDVEIARADVEDRIELLPPGQLGEVVIRGHNVMLGYFNRPAATAQAIVDGWFRSGDIGVKDADGFLSIVDRKKDMVLRGGYNVYPREIEEVLIRHPSVSHVAVIGLPHELHGEEVCAVLVPSPGTEPDAELSQEIIRYAKERLAAYKYPRIVRFVDSFPLGPSGKVLKRELVAQLTR